MGLQNTAQQQPQIQPQQFDPNAGRSNYAPGSFGPGAQLQQQGIQQMGGPLTPIAWSGYQPQVQQGLSSLGRLGKNQIGQVNVSTPNMQSLENNATAQLLGQMNDPYGYFNQLFGNTLPQVPGYQGFNSNMQQNPAMAQLMQAGQPNMNAWAPSFQLPQMGQPTAGPQGQIASMQQQLGAQSGPQYGGVYSQGSPFANVLGQNPEAQALQTAQNLLGGAFNEGGAGWNLTRGGVNGQGVVNSMRQAFDANLGDAMNQLTNQVPSVRNTGAAVAGTDLARGALNDFNTTAAQALLQAQGLNMQGQVGGLNALSSGINALTGAAGQAGMNPYQRVLGAGTLGSNINQQQYANDIQQNLGLGQLGLGAQGNNIQQLLGLGGLGVQQQLGLGGLGQQNYATGVQQQLGLTNAAQGQNQFINSLMQGAQNQQWNQAVNPTLQLLINALGYGTPTAYQTIVR